MILPGMILQLIFFAPPGEVVKKLIFERLVIDC